MKGQIGSRSAPRINPRSVPVEVLLGNRLQITTAFHFSWPASLVSSSDAQNKCGCDGKHTLLGAIAPQPPSPTTTKQVKRLAEGLREDGNIFASLVR